MVQVVKEEYFLEKHALPGPEQPVNFESNQIKLDVPQEGIRLSSGWVITPLTAPFVSANVLLLLWSCKAAQLWSLY